MPREQNVPLLLWICTALCAHIATSGGAEQLSRVIEERADLRDFARSVRQRLHPATTFEVSFVEDGAPRPPDDPESPPPELPKVSDPEKAPAPPAPKPEPRKAEPEKKADEKKVVHLFPTPAQPTPPPPPPPQVDHRIAVRQHAEPNQDDNPNAKYVGDEANHVAEETASQITSHDQDDPSPTPGGQHQGPTKAPGNSEEQRVGESQEHAGDPTHAPGENATKPDERPSQQKVASNAAAPKSAPMPHPAARGGEKHAASQAPQPAPPPPGGLGPASPETVASEAGGYRLDPARPGNDGATPKPGPGPSKLPMPEPTATSRVSMLGLGGAPTPGGVNLNLNQEGIVATVGQDQLTRERMADGERRKSAHRGSWQASGFERWRSAIENYVASVKPGNQTALNTARVPFATYLNTIHNRIHPIFADDFLGSLDGLPANHPMNEPHLITKLEIVLDRDDGHVTKMGVVRTSGVTAFDIAALDAVQRASPFGKPPGLIVSPDGGVYFHWEFHRDPIYACSTMNARPFMLNVPAPTQPGSPPPPSILPGDPREQGVPDPSQGSRQGFFLPLPPFAPTSRKPG